MSNNSPFSSASSNDNMNVKTNINSMKKSLTLDFNQVKKNNNLQLLGQSVLSSPDLNMLKVGTPELENMILANGMPNTPTPSLIYPRAVTAEQESFVGGFEEALSHLHNSHSQQGSDSNASTAYNDAPFIPSIKEEPQTVPTISSSPPMSPVDMDYQERLKLERKRQRNRLAASKCRSRKLERISKLEDKVKLLKSDNSNLASVVNQLKEEVGLLKLEVLEHNKAGCQVMMF